MTITSTTLSSSDHDPLAVVSTTNDEESVEPISLAEAKAHLRVVGNDEDDMISMMIVAAREMLENRINRVLRVRDVVEWAHGFSNEIPLSVVPYLDGLQISYVDADGASQVLSEDSYYIDATRTPARISVVPGLSWPYTPHTHNSVVVQYRAGYNGEIPASLRYWMLLAIGTLYAQRESMVIGVSVVELPKDFMSLLFQKYVVYL